MTIYENRVVLDQETENRSMLRRDGDPLRLPRLAPLEIFAVAVAVVMALGPLSAYAVGMI